MPDSNISLDDNIVTLTKYLHQLKSTKKKNDLKSYNAIHELHIPHLKKKKMENKHTHQKKKKYTKKKQKHIFLNSSFLYLFHKTFEKEDDYDDDSDMQYKIQYTYIRKHTPNFFFFFFSQKPCYVLILQPNFHHTFLFEY